MPTCNFYHFLVSFAFRASPEDIHKEQVRETERKAEGVKLYSDVEREREKRLRNKRAKWGKEGEKTHMTECELRRDKARRQTRKNKKDRAKQRLKTRSNARKKKGKRNHKKKKKNRPPTQWGHWFCTAVVCCIASCMSCMQHHCLCTNLSKVYLYVLVALTPMRAPSFLHRPVLHQCLLPAWFRHCFRLC